MRLWRGRTQDAQGGQAAAEGRRLAEGTGPPGGAGTQEDWYWGRRGASAGGLEEDYYWRRLSDNWYQKDVIPATYLEIHNQCYEAYNANPLANYDRGDDHQLRAGHRDHRRGREPAGRRR